MEITKASEEQYSAVRAFYHSMIDSMTGSACDLHWRKDVYPGPDFLIDSIRGGELYIAVDTGEILASMVLNHVCNDSCQEAQWTTEAQAGEVTIIHALGVHPAHKGREIGRQMVQSAIETARRNRQKAVRLDVLKENLLAERLYESMGFRRIHTLRMFYESTGWMEFVLYEYRI